MAKKNSKKNKFKSKDRFRNSIITNESVVSSKENSVDSSLSVDSPSFNTSITSTKTQSLAGELKLIGIIGISLFAILVVSSFVI